MAALECSICLSHFSISSLLFLHGAGSANSCRIMYVWRQTVVAITQELEHLSNFVKPISAVCSVYCALSRCRRVTGWCSHLSRSATLWKPRFRIGAVERLDGRTSQCIKTRLVVLHRHHHSSVVFKDRCASPQTPMV